MTSVQTQDQPLLLVEHKTIIIGSLTTGVCASAIAERPDAWPVALIMALFTFIVVGYDYKKHTDGVTTILMVLALFAAIGACFGHLAISALT